MEKKSMGRRGHCLVLAYPVQGHHSRASVLQVIGTPRLGIRITLVTTCFYSKNLQKVPLHLKPFLRECSCYFLWAVRISKENKHPKDFEEKTKRFSSVMLLPTKDLVVSCFVTHCDKCKSKEIQRPATSTFGSARLHEGNCTMTHETGHGYCFCGVHSLLFDTSDKVMAYGLSKTRSNVYNFEKLPKDFEK
ncbi:hypothetical protein CR513_19075, partial [Mucuna pruriens]